MWNINEIRELIIRSECKNVNSQIECYGDTMFGCVFCFTWEMIVLSAELIETYERGI